MIVVYPDGVADIEGAKNNLSYWIDMEKQGQATPPRRPGRGQEEEA